MATDGAAPVAAGRQNTWPGRTSPTWTGQRGAADSDLDFDTSDSAQRAEEPRMSRWIGWRLRLLVACALLGCLGIFSLIRTLTDAHHLDATWRANSQSRIELIATRDPALVAHTGQALVGIVGGTETVALTDATALLRSARWLIDDRSRARQQSLHQQLAAALSADRATLYFADGSSAMVAPAPSGVTGLPAMFWLLVSFALALYLAGAVIGLAQPSARSLLFAVMSTCQAANLVFMAIELSFDLGMPQPFARLDMPVRMALDLVTAAAMVNAICLHPRRLPGSGWLALAGWGVAIGLVSAYGAGAIQHVWWWTQGTVFALTLMAIALLSWSYQIEPHPYALVLRRFAIVTAATWALLTMVLASAEHFANAPRDLAEVVSIVWYVFLGSLLMLVPFFAKSENFMREFALLAAISTVATSLDLLFVVVFSLGQFASLALSLFVSMAVYSGVRRWILQQLLGNNMLTTERMFEQLYRIAREVEARPETMPALLSQLLGDLFEPLQIEVIEHRTNTARMTSDGASMLVPVPMLGGAGAPRNAVRIRFAQRGRRLFTAEDARLTNRIVEQLRRAVRYDKAVEQGRSEERMRLAQDLHDDIGARLLTLMYKAQSPEMEDYVRHTLQDLKTLTRGLAASNHRLSHAAAEWKSDLAHRLTAAHVELRWSFVFDDDILLTVVHWSALTRVLRELVSNAIAHSQAQRLDVDFRLENDRIELAITDDGIGRNPRAWSHGLGLSGVRKRVKQLGGEVEWREAAPHGICCRVLIRDVSARW